MQDGRIRLGFGTEVHQQRCITAIIKDHVGLFAIRPLEDFMGVFPVFLKCFALDAKHAASP